MPTRFGADGGFASTTSGGVFDSSGNPIVSADNEFGAAPLGPAALAQTLFSVPNGTFNILPPDIDIPISNENPLPYWSSPVDNSDGEMIAQVVYNTTSNTYSLRMDPGSALSGDTLSITTRSAVISDDNLSLRQKAIATLEKVGTYAGTTQVNLKLDATYYDHTGTQLSTNPIGTVFDNGTVSSLAEFTTAGTAIVGISAAYVDLTFTMTATANVTSGIAFDIDTILLQTSQGGGGGGGASSFLITETFTTSDTWTRPTGVENLLAIICVGGGGGGASGGLDIGTGSSAAVAEGGGGGASGAFAYLTNVYIGTATSYTVTVGAGGSGGTATTVSKADGGTTTTDLTPVQGAAGGTSSFGTFVFGNGASATGRDDQVYNGGGGGAFSSPIWGIQFQSANGVNGGPGGRNNLVPAGTASVAGTFVARSYTSLPLVSTSIPTPGSPTAATAGTFVTSAFGAGTVFTAAGTAAATAGSGYFIQSGGGGGAGAIEGGASSPVAGAGGAGQPGAGGGGGGAGVRVTGGGTSNNGSASVTGGDGGNATGTAGAGGGGGGGAFFRANTGTTLGNVVVNATSGKGGNGSQGFVIISYVG
jgi:hypothetical protein